MQNLVLIFSTKSHFFVIFTFSHLPTLCRRSYFSCHFRRQTPSILRMKLALFGGCIEMKKFRAIHLGASTVQACYELVAVTGMRIISVWCWATVAGTCDWVNKDIVNLIMRVTIKTRLYWLLHRNIAKKASYYSLFLITEKLPFTYLEERPSFEETEKDALVSFKYQGKTRVSNPQGVWLVIPTAYEDIEMYLTFLLSSNINQKVCGISSWTPLAVIGVQYLDVLMYFYISNHSFFYFNQFIILLCIITYKFVVFFCR